MPEWNGYYPNLSAATDEQRQFYSYWLEQFKKGNLLEIDGNLSYVFVFAYSAIESFIKDRDIARLSDYFERLARGYAEYKTLKKYLNAWTAEAYLYVGDYDKAWERIREGRGDAFFGMEDFVNFRSKCKDTSIDAQDLMFVLGTNNGLTEFGKKYQEPIENIAITLLAAFHNKYGKNLIEYFCGQFNFSGLTEDDFVRLREYYSNESDFYRWKELYESYEKKKCQSKWYDLFCGVPLERSPLIECDCERVPNIVRYAFMVEGKKIMREAENEFREERNLPKIGEGWISETELFHKLRETFPNEQIVHHGRPTWLSRQHLDIYFPLRNIGIEYQGIQHKKPVECFGGEKSFKKLQALDKRKAQLCKENACKLILVGEESDHNDIIHRVIQIIIEEKDKTNRV